MIISHNGISVVSITFHFTASGSQVPTKLGGTLGKFAEKADLHDPARRKVSNKVGEPGVHASLPACLLFTILYNAFLDRLCIWVSFCDLLNCLL